MSIPLRQAGCRFCAERTNGDCGAHGPVTFNIPTSTPPIVPLTAGLEMLRARYVEGHDGMCEHYAHQAWPCDVARVLNALDAALAEAGAIRAAAAEMLESVCGGETLLQRWERDLRDALGKPSLAQEWLTAERARVQRETMEKCCAALCEFCRTSDQWMPSMALRVDGPEKPGRWFHRSKGGRFEDASLEPCKAAALRALGKDT